MERKAHWESVYTNKPPERLGWYEPHLRTSLRLIREAGIDKTERIIDVGGGASTLVDDLLDDGFAHITVLDLSAAALDHARARLGARAEKVIWIEGDITSVSLHPGYYGMWHDRAVFHFLIEKDDRNGYATRLQYSLKPGGHVVIGVFSLEAPPRCSGLDIERYTPERLNQELGEGLTLLGHNKELHVTPGGVEQVYLYCHFEKAA